MPDLQFLLLGSPRLEKNGQPIEVDTRKAIALLAYLVMQREEQSRETLAALLWSEYDQTRAMAALRRTLSTIKKALEDKNLQISRERVGLSAKSDLQIDVIEFQDLLAKTGTHGHPADQVCPTCITLLMEAVKLYRGDFMAGFTLRDSPEFDNWQFFQSETLRRDFASTLHRLVRGLSIQRNYEEAIQYARRWSALDSLNEEAHRELMLLYIWSGQRNAALRQYRECVRILEEELGVPPLEETTQVYQAILEHNPPAEPSLPGREATSEDDRRQVQPAVATTTVKPGILENAFRLVGREDEWNTLAEAYRKSFQGGYFLILEGETGIGKTRLAQEFVETIQSQAMTILSAPCFEGERHLAYAPFLACLRSALDDARLGTHWEKVPAHWLSEAARLLPEIAARFPDIHPALAREDPGAQGHFFEGLRQVFMALLDGRPPGVLFLDDLHWADAASFEFLSYLSHRLQNSRVFILVTWNTDTAFETPKMGRLIADLQRSGKAARLKLPRLKEAEVAELVEQFPEANFESTSKVHERLYEESEGLPFLAVEYLKALLQNGQVNSATAWEIPSGARELLRSRIATLDDAAGQLLSTAAVIGRSFDFDTLRAASGRNELETVSGLESLLTQSLITEKGITEVEGDIRYGFTHEKIRQITLEEISMTRRRLLHRRVAEALVNAGRRQHDPGSVASLAAYHYQQGGQEALAAQSYKIAGEHARQIFANVEALAHYQAALALGHPQIAELHEAVGDLHTLQGEYPVAIDHYQKAAALCKPSCLVNLEHKLGNVHYRLGNWDLAECHYQVALEASETDCDPVILSRLYADLSRTAYHREQIEQALKMAQLALDLAEETGNQEALAQAHNILGILNRREGRIAQATAHFEKSLKLAVTFSDPGARAAALNNLALNFADGDQIEQAIELSEEALSLCVKLGDRHREAALHNNLADLYHAAGREDESLAELKKAVVIFAEIGVEGGDLKSEIWMLTEW